MEKSKQWKLLFWVSCGAMLVSCFIGVFTIDAGWLGSYSMSFYDMAFSEIGDTTNVLFFIFPIAFVVISLLHVDWKYLSIGLYILNGIALLLMLSYIPSFTEGVSPGAGYFIYIIALIFADTFNDKIKKELKEEAAFNERTKTAATYSRFSCPACGAPLKNNAKFCEKCGQPINWQSDGTLNASLQENTLNIKEDIETSDKVSGEKLLNVGTEITGNDKKHCSVCGAEVSENDRFCQKCGNKLF